MEKKELEKIVRQTEIKSMTSYLTQADRALKDNCLDDAKKYLSQYTVKRYSDGYKGEDIDKLDKQCTTLFDKYIKGISYEFFKDKS